MINLINSYLDKTNFDFISLKKSDLGKIFYENEGELLNEIQNKIKVLSESSAESFWKNIISEKNLSKMQLDRYDWICNLEWENIVFWIDDYNDNKYKKIENVLCKNLNWDSDLSIYFCCGYSDIIKTTWGVFARYWMNFVEYDDDGPMIFAKNKEKIIRITSLGYFQVSTIPTTSLRYTL